MLVDCLDGRVVKLRRVFRRGGSIVRWVPALLASGCSEHFVFVLLGGPLSMLTAVCRGSSLIRTVTTMPSRRRVFLMMMLELVRVHLAGRCFFCGR